jgi:pimeloyl-ACP methyl ester carboxylesterase
LQSTPVTFADLVNEIRGDAQLRTHFQIWQYAYPTGTPVFYNSLEMRRILGEAIKQMDPTGSHFATNHITVLGHSLGGLMTHTLASSSESKIWDAVITVPPAQLHGDPNEIHDVERYFFFKRNHRVVRAIFVSTPHRGSPLADGLIGRIGQAFVKLPDPFTKSLAQLTRENRDHMVPSAYRLYRGGRLSVIRALSSRNNALIALANLPLEVPFNSIIGQHSGGPVATGSDGVVPYASSHLAGAESELVVRSGHDSYKSPAAVAEIRRILRKTIARVGKAFPNAVQPTESVVQLR